MSSLKPRPTCISCGRLCIEKRKALCVAGGLQNLCKVAVSERRKLVQHHNEHGRFVRRRCSSLSQRFPATSCRFCNSTFPSARTGSMFL